MKLQRSHCTALVVLALGALSACASSPQNAGADRAAEVKIYEPAQLSQDQYQLVRYLPVDSWRTALWLPTYATVDAGLASLRAEAARQGANGLINVSCRDQGSYKGFSSNEPALLCYGNAVNVREASQQKTR